MLEAIHLLLAVELFVVVVAVDPRWLLQALHSHYRDQLSGPADGTTVADDERALWRPSAVQYLEKIFQVVLTLPPLATGGYGRPGSQPRRPQPTRRSRRRSVSSRTRPAAAPAPQTPARSACQCPHPGQGSAGRRSLRLTRRGLSARWPRIIERSDPLAFSGS